MKLRVTLNIPYQRIRQKRLLVAAITSVACFLLLQSARAAEDLWAHDNLFAWGTAPFDAKQRGPEERAQMLQGLGFMHIAFNWRVKNIPLFETEIEALRKHGIHLLAWALYVVDDPGKQVNWNDYRVADGLTGEAQSTMHLSLGELLKIFQRHRVQPQLWLIQFQKPKDFPSQTHKMSADEEIRAINEFWREDFPKTPEEQELRIRQEANRIAPLVRLAARYGVKVELYNHNAWFGMMENQLAVIQRLKGLGVGDVGMVYNFDHARDSLHDDTTKFPALWAQMQPHVIAVNVSGTTVEPMHRYPSQGDRELEMMRVIENSGWRGPVGLNTETGGDAEVTLRNCLLGLDWLAAELKQPGSGGPRPFSLVR